MNVIMLIVIILGVIMLSAFMLIAIMLSVIVLSVILLSTNIRLQFDDDKRSSLLLSKLRFIRKTFLFVDFVSVIIKLSIDPKGDNATELLRPHRFGTSIS
jgi:hypothetical protein